MTGTLDHAATRAELLRRRLSGTAAPRPGGGIGPARRDRPLPLSSAQRRMWILDQLRPGSTEYLMTTAVRLRGPLAPAALRATLDAVVARHEVLRTRYPVVDGEPVQVVDAPCPAELTELDLRHLDPAEQDRRIAGLGTGGRTPVDLAAGPVLRATLARLADDEHALLLTVHHIASDGWSEDVLLREIGTGYVAAAAGREQPWAPLPVQYADFAAWQRDRLAGPGAERQLGYWRERLAGLTPVELPTDRPRPAVRDAAGDLLPFTVPAPVAAALRRLAQQHGATPFMVLLAATEVLLARWTGRTDVAVGTPVAGRERPEVQDLVGLFLNTLVVRTDLADDPSFAEVLTRVRSAVLDGYSSQDVPFERLVEELAPERDPARTPLFSTFVLWQEAATAAPPAGGPVVEPLQVGETTAKFDLTVSATQRADGSLAGALTYATALFDRSTVQRVAGHLVQLLTAAAADPHAPVGSLELLPPAERRQVLIDWNDTAVPYPTGTLGELVGAQAARTPDAVAVRAAGTELTYAELRDRADRLAHRLRRLGVGPESVVGVCLPRSADLVVALLAVVRAGGAYLPLDPDYPADRLAYMLADSGARVVISDEDRIALDGRTLVDIGADLSAEPGGDPRPGVDPDAAAYVIYTSGSTGRPKGVLVSHRGIVNRLRWMQDEYGLDATDRVLQKTPYSFDVSVWEFFWPLSTGATLVVADPGGHRDPAYLARLIAAERITTVHFVPSMLRAFLAEPFAGLPALRRVLCSGEALPADLVDRAAQRFGCPLHNLYGPTEASVDVTAVRCEPGQPVTIGRPIANTRTYVVDRALRPVPIGAPGELVLAGVQLARGYLGRPGLTAERFVPDPFAAEPGGRLYRTGDLARLRPDGAIDYLGRLDSQVKVHGHRIELGEVEAVLTEHPAVDAAAVAVHDDQLVAYVVPGTDLGAVRQHLRGRLPEPLLPAHWVPLAALPLTASGKTDRKALPRPERTRAELTAGYVAPRTDSERTVARAMADALGVDSVGVHDSFFLLGGDSMRAIRVVGALRAAGVAMSVHDMFTHQTAADLAALIGRTDPAPDGADRLVEPFELVSAADRDLLPDGLADAYPLAQTQAGMVYEMLAAADRAVYQNVSCYRVRDDLPFDLDALRAAGRLLVERHEILRTSFDLSSFSETMQLVHREAELPIGVTDLTGLPADEQRRIVDTYLVEERSRQIDVVRPPLLRYHVHRISPSEFWLTHTECHAILDGWSHTSVVAELVESYRAFRRGVRPDLAPPPEVRFADFVALERAALDSAADRDFWAGTIEGTERFELPETWGVPAADRRATILDVPYADLLPGLRALAATAGGSMKSVLHAAHLKALGTVTGRTRFFDGLVCNGRPEQAGGDEVRGMYLNTVPFAADLSAPTWRELVADVFAGEARLWPHRRYPMPAMQRGRSANLIEVAFGYLDFHVLDWSTGAVGMVDDFSPSELPLEVWTFPGLLRLGGRPSRIGPDRLALLARVYRHVLEAMAADPDGDARALGLPAADAAAAVAAGNDTDRAFPTDRLVHELVGDRAGADPDAVALRRATETVGYAELDRRANGLAHRLRAAGVRTGTVVGLHLPRGPEQVVALLAVLRSGGAFLPLDPDYPADRLRYMVADAGVTTVLGTAGTARAGLGDVRTLLVGTEERAAPPAVDISLDDLAYVIYTSGSTGQPKGVAVPHRGALNLRHAQLGPLDVRPGDAVLQFSSPSFDASVWEVLMALTNGVELVLPPAGSDAGDLRTQAAVVTHMTLPPSVLDRLSPADFPRLRVVVSAGEACTPDHAARWARHARFVNAYGPTETSVCATLMSVPGTGIPAAPPIGLPLANVRAYVLDDGLRPLPAGVRGGLYVGGPGLARGYLNRPGLTADRFLPDPYGDVPGGRLYRTGDTVSRNPDGTLQYHGRVDQQVKVRGLRIETGEIEDALAAHPAVAGAVVTVHRAGTQDATLVAYTRAAPGTAATPAELRDHLRQWLPASLLPSHYLTVAAFPTTPAGKIDRTALPAPDGNRPELGAAYVEPRTELERVIADSWRQALGLERVGVNDDFFELGGHSLAMMRIIATLRAGAGVELRFRSFVEHRTVAGLAGTLGGPGGLAPTGAMLWIRREGTRTPLVCVHPGGGSAHWYSRLAPHLDPDVPVIAFEWPGPHPGGTPGAEAMAERYLAELRAAQPHGPYRLFSWCGGSGIATELAHKLLEAGEKVTFALLDPGLDVHTRPEGWKEFGLIQRLDELVRMVDEGGPAADTPERRREILDLLEHLVDDVDEDSGITLPEHGVGAVWPRAVRIWREVMEMDLAYRHRRYAGDLHLVVSDELAAGAHEVADGQSFADYLGRWRELMTGGVHLHRVPGDHFGVMRAPHVTRLAAVLGGLLDGS